MGKRARSLESEPGADQVGSSLWRSGSTAFVEKPTFGKPASLRRSLGKWNGSLVSSKADLLSAACAPRAIFELVLIPSLIACLIQRIMKDCGSLLPYDKCSLPKPSGGSQPRSPPPARLSGPTGYASPPPPKPKPPPPPVPSSSEESDAVVSEASKSKVGPGSTAVEIQVQTKTDLRSSLHCRQFRP